MNFDLQRKAAGYTHKVEWKEFHEVFGTFIDHMFYTTPDVLVRYQEVFSKRGITLTITEL